MAQMRAADDSPAVDRQAWKDLLYQFEQAWQRGAAPWIGDYWPAGRPRHDPAARQLLQELVRIDLEYRWRCQSAAGKPWLLENYVTQFPELGPLEELPLELVGQEYEVRHCWGDRPTCADFARRFPKGGVALQALFAQIDAKLLAEYGPAEAAFMGRRPIASVAALMDALEKYGLLSAAQRREIDPARFSEPRALAGELLKRGWLTPYLLADAEAVGRFRHEITSAAELPARGATSPAASS